MKLLKANRKMLKRHARSLARTDLPLPRFLRKVLAEGLAEVEDCVCFRSQVKGVDHVVKRLFHDYTGFECFVNHFHIDDFPEARDMVGTATTLLAKVSVLLSRDYPDRRFHGIISSRKGECTVRFVTVRDEPPAVDDNLENYKEEGVCLFEL